MTQYFTFQNECTRKYSPLLYSKILEIFNALPLCAIVNDQLFCVHGGISPSLKTIKDIEKIDRFREPPSNGLYCDLIWSDPSPTYDYDAPDGDFFSSNRVRGCSYSYHFRAVLEFLSKNNLLCIVRAHEAQAAGYRMYKTNPQTLFPTVITLFSAPNYVDIYNNKGTLFQRFNLGAIMYYDGKTMDIRQFSHSPHPYHLPNMMDAFSWSIPFVGQKITDMLLTILTSAVDSDALTEAHDDPMHIDAFSSKDAEDDNDVKKEGMLRTPLVHKIRAVSKMIRSYNFLRKERESIIELKALMRSDKLPFGTLALGAEGIRQAISTFEVAKRSDIDNEHIPPESENSSSMRHILTPSEIKQTADVGDGLERKTSSIHVTEAVVVYTNDENGLDKPAEAILIPPVVIDNASSGVSEEPEKFIHSLKVKGGRSFKSDPPPISSSCCRSWCGIRKCFNRNKQL